MGKITRACCYNTFEFFYTKAAATEFRQPNNVIVLSTNKLMESDHGMSLSANLLAMESGILYTLALSSPPVKHIPKNGRSLFTNHCRKTCVKHCRNLGILVPMLHLIWQWFLSSLTLILRQLYYNGTFA